MWRVGGQLVGYLIWLQWIGEALPLPSGAGTIFMLSGAQLTFASVIHDRKKPIVPPNLVLSSVTFASVIHDQRNFCAPKSSFVIGFRPLIFHSLSFSPIKTKQKCKKKQPLCSGWWFGHRPHSLKVGASCPHCPLLVLRHISYNRIYEVTSG